MPGKYTLLEKHPAGLPVSTQEITLTFEHIENIICDKLPASAYRHQAWWSNEKEGSHVQAHGWMYAGWLVDSIDQKAAWVRFMREKK